MRTSYLGNCEGLVGELNDLAVQEVGLQWEVPSLMFFLHRRLHFLHWELILLVPTTRVQCSR